MDLVEAYAAGEDVYSIFATKLFKSAVWKAKGDEPPMIIRILKIRRGFGKDSELGLGYGMGSPRFYNNCLSNPDLRPLFDDGTYDFAFIEKLIKIYRTRYKKIPKFWRAVEKAYKYVTRYPGKSIILPCGIGFDSEGTTTYIRLLSGRYIRYPNANVNVYGDIRYKYGSLWGGTLVENIVQATARDILSHAIVNTEFYNIVLHCHDSLVYMIPKNGAESMMDLIKSVLLQKPDWAEGLPLDVESKISKELE